MISPAADYIVAVQDKPKTQTKSGLYLPEDSSQISNSAKVLATGSKVYDYKVDEKIVFKKITERVTIDDTEYLIINTEDVVATL